MMNFERLTLPLLALSYGLALSPAVSPARAAQAPAPQSTVTILVLPAAGTVATVPSLGSRVTAISATSPNCNLAPVPAAGTSSVVNPTTVMFDDPFNAGRSCTAPLPLYLPPGVGYRVAATFALSSCVTAAGVTLTPCPSTARSLVGTPTFSVGAAPPPVVVKASPDWTRIPPLNPAPITDAAMAIWTIGPGLTILRNGVQAAGGLGTVILWQAGTIYVLGDDNAWWAWQGGAWVYFGVRAALP